MLRRRCLAKLRKEVEPAPPEALAAFLPAWQNAGQPAGKAGRRGAAGRTDPRLAPGQRRTRSSTRSISSPGAALPASALETLVLPGRVPGYQPAVLDELTAAGEVVWSGAGGLPGGDGWVVLAPAQAAAAAAAAARRDHDDAGARRGAGGAGGRRRPVLPDARRPGRRDAAGSRLARAVRHRRGGGDLGPRLGGTADQRHAGAVAHGPRQRPSGVRRVFRRDGRRFPRRRARQPGRLRGRTVRAARRGPAVRAERCRASRRLAGPGPGRAADGRARPDGCPPARLRPAGGAHEDRAADGDRAVVAAARPGSRPDAAAARDRPGTAGPARHRDPRHRGGRAHARAGSARLYPVLRAMEEAGQCRRGYFVEGLGAAQFALPGAVDRMRAIAAAQEAAAAGPPAESAQPRWPGQPPPPQPWGPAAGSAGRALGVPASG